MCKPPRRINDVNAQCIYHEEEQSCTADFFLGDIYTVTTPVPPKHRHAQTSLNVLKIQHDRHIIKTAGKIDTGVGTNVMPLHIYKMISKDYDIKHLECSHFEITTYDGINIANLGETTLIIRHNEINHKVKFQIARSGNIMLHRCNDAKMTWLCKIPGQY